MKKSIRGFCNDDVSRKLIQRHKLLGDVIKVEELDVEVDVTFDSASIEFEENTHRPYIFFREGHITAVTGDFPYDVIRCNFTRKNAPDLELQWNLSNEEIKELTDKGLYGYDDSYPKLKSIFEIPDIFTEVLWSKIPVKANVYAFETELDNGAMLPLISIEILNQYDQVTNSRISGYENIASYFARPEFYDERYIDDKNEYFTLSDEEVLGLVDTDSDEKNDNINRVDTIKVLSPSEQQEEAIRGKLRQQIRENIESITSQNMVDDIARIDENLDIDFIKKSDETKVVGEYEPYTADELEALHIVAHKDEIHKAAEAKIAAQAIKGNP